MIAPASQGYGGGRPVTVTQSHVSNGYVLPDADQNWQTSESTDFAGSTTNVCCRAICRLPLSSLQIAVDFAVRVHA